MKGHPSLFSLLPALAVAMFSPSAARATPGDFDVTFGYKGRVVPEGHDFTLTSLARQSDGKILVGGTFHQIAGWDFAVSRYLPDGTPDTSFGTGTGSGVAGGTTSIHVDGKDYSGLVSLAAGEGGKITGAGFSGSPPGKDLMVVRFTATGHPDTTFGNNGLVKVARPEYEGAVSIATIPGGKTLVMYDGVSVATGKVVHNLTILRLNNDGSLDTTFSGSGKIVINGLLPAKNMVVRKDGRILAAGYARLPGNEASPRSALSVVRLLADGTPDLAFGDLGIATTENTGEYVSVQLEETTNGTTTLAGTLYFTTSPEGYNHLFIKRLLPDGTPDPSLAGTGTLIDSESSTSGYVAIRPDGGVVAFDYNANMKIVSRDAQGQVDVEYQGTAVKNPGFSSRAVIFSPEDQTMIAGGANPASGYNVVIARLVEQNRTPEIAIQSPGGSELTNEAGADLESVTAGGSREYTFTLRNTGTDPLTITDTFLSETDGPFTLTSPPPSTIPGKSSATFTLKFAPVKTGSFTATLHLLTNDPDEGLFMVSLTAKGVPTPFHFTVLSPSGATLTTDGAVDLGLNAMGTETLHTFTLRNDGAAPLSLLGFTLTPSTLPVEPFVVVPPSTTVLAAGASTTFGVKFTPPSVSEFTTRLAITTSDAGGSAFELLIEGQGSTRLAMWRQAYFGSAEATGDRADTADFDHDGVPNLLEYATAGNPTLPTGAPGTLEIKDGEMEYTIQRPVSATADISYSLEVTGNLKGPWTPFNITPAVISSANGVETVKFSVPAGSPGKRFLRLRVTRL